MKYKYKNNRHIFIKGIAPGHTEEFDVELFDFGLELVEPVDDKKIKMNKKTKESEDSLIGDD